MKFYAYGPFELPRENGLISSDKQRIKQFWEHVEKHEKCLSKGCGCYVFVINRTPWYVGKAERQSFRKECFQPQKQVHYNAALSKFSRARPYLYLIPKLTNTGGFASPATGKNGKPAIDNLEDLLIGMAIRANPELRNIAGTKFLRELNVPGLINSTQGQSRLRSAQMLKRILSS